MFFYGSGGSGCPGREVTAQKRVFLTCADSSLRVTERRRSRLAPGSPWDRFPGTRGGLQSPIKKNPPRPRSGCRRDLPWRVGMIFFLGPNGPDSRVYDRESAQTGHFYPCPTGNRPDFCRRELHASRWNFCSGFWCIEFLLNHF